MTDWFWRVLLFGSLVMMWSFSGCSSGNDDDSEANDDDTQNTCVIEPACESQIPEGFDFRCVENPRPASQPDGSMVTVTGHVSDLYTGQSIEGIEVEAHDADGNPLFSGVTDADGNVEGTIPANTLITIGGFDPAGHYAPGRGYSYFVPEEDYTIHAVMVSTAVLGAAIEMMLGTPYDSDSCSFVTHSLDCTGQVGEQYEKQPNGHTLRVEVEDCQNPGVVGYGGGQCPSMAGAAGLSDFAGNIRGSKVTLQTIGNSGEVLAERSVPCSPGSFNIVWLAPDERTLELYTNQFLYLR